MEAEREEVLSYSPCSDKKNLSVSCTIPICSSIFIVVASAILGCAIVLKTPMGAILKYKLTYACAICFRKKNYSAKHAFGCFFIF
jgi:hypothetical protein